MPHTSAAKGRLAALGWAEAPAPLSWRARLAILRDAARALSHLHAQSLLHGDVKPSNILLGGGGGGARLADFGLSRMAKTQEAPSGATQASVSAVKGTAAFLDPIYVQSGQLTELTDGFALGCAPPGVERIDVPALAQPLHHRVQLAASGRSAYLLGHRRGGAHRRRTGARISR